MSILNLLIALCSETFCLLTFFKRNSRKSASNRNYRRIVRLFSCICLFRYFRSLPKQCARNTLFLRHQHHHRRNIFEIEGDVTSKVPTCICIYRTTSIYNLNSKDIFVGEIYLDRLISNNFLLFFFFFVESEQMLASFGRLMFALLILITVRKTKSEENQNYH